MPSSTFCLHGYLRLYVSFTQSGTGAAEQIYTVLTLPEPLKIPQCKSSSSKIVLLWKPIVPVDSRSPGQNSNFLFQTTPDDRTWGGEGEQHLTERLFPKHPASMEETSQSPIQRYLCLLYYSFVVLTERIVSFLFIPLIFIDNNRTLLILPFSRLSTVTVLNYSGWQHLSFLKCVPQDTHVSFFNTGHWKHT